MNKDEVLIIKPQFPVKAETMNDIHKKLIEQAKTGIVLLPYGYEVVIAPKDVEIKTETQYDEKILDKILEEGKLELPGVICTNENMLNKRSK